MCNTYGTATAQLHRIAWLLEALQAPPVTWTSFLRASTVCHSTSFHTTSVVVSLLEGDGD